MTARQRAALFTAAAILFSIMIILLPAPLRSPAAADTAQPSPVPAAPGAAEAQARFYELMSEHTGLAAGEYPDDFAGSYIGEADGLLHIEFTNGDALGYYKTGLAEYEGAVVFGTAAYSRNALAAHMDAILSEFLKAGVRYSSYSVHAPTNSIRITVPREELSAAETVLSQLDCVQQNPDIPVFLSDGSFEGLEPAQEEQPKGSGFPILAVLLTLAGVGVFFLRRRAQKRRIMRMGF